MENNSIQQDSIFGFTLTPNLREQLSTAAKWGKIVAIIGLVNTGISLLAQLTKARGLSSAGIGGLLGSLIVTALYIVLYVFLLNFGRKVSKGIVETEQGIFNEGLNDLRLYFKIGGIVVIVCLSILVLAFIIAILSGVGNRF